MKNPLLFDNREVIHRSFLYKNDEVRTVDDYIGRESELYDDLSKGDLIQYEVISREVNPFDEKFYIYYKMNIDKNVSYCVAPIDSDFKDFI